MSKQFCVHCWETRRPLWVQVNCPAVPAVATPQSEAAARKRARLRSNLVTAHSPRRAARNRCDCDLPNPLPCFNL